MESGADNLVTSECPTSRSQDCWNEASDANTLAAADAVRPFVQVAKHVMFVACLFLCVTGVAAVVFVCV